MVQTTTREFWKSAGAHLLRRAEDGWLIATPEFIRAYLTRPEVHPIDGESCEAEYTLHEALMEDPFRSVSPSELEAIADADTRENYGLVLDYRETLQQAGTLEAAYLRIIRGEAPAPPAVFLTQMVHVILRNILDGVEDPIRLRAAEVFFREQSVSTSEGRLMLADEEIVSMHARTQSSTGIGQLLADTGTPLRSVTLDVLDEDNAGLYWNRSDRFDTVIDFRFEQPALDAFARVLEAWTWHLLRLRVAVEPRPNVSDPDWRWHIGLDETSNAILNALYNGKDVDHDDLQNIIGLFRLRIADDEAVLDQMKGRMVYLALAKGPDDVVRMKPQNLLTNLPLQGLD